nr:MAG TPA: hypothetical protein [Caudoviricetes sp.]
MYNLICIDELIQDLIYACRCCDDLDFKCP